MKIYMLNIFKTFKKFSLELNLFNYSSNKISTLYFQNIIVKIFKQNMTLLFIVFCCVVIFKTFI